MYKQHLRREPGPGSVTGFSSPQAAGQLKVIHPPT